MTAARALAVGVALVLVLVGCTSSPDPAPAATGPVDVAPLVGPPPAVDPGCTELLAGLPPGLPAKKGALQQRPVADAGRTAAWGDPAVTLLCGAPEPDPQLEPLELRSADGTAVTFAVDDIGAGYAFTTVGRPVPVVVTVPDDYDSQVLVPLLPALRS